MKRHLLTFKGILRGVMAAFLSLASLSITAQQLQCTYTIKKGETLFAIAKRYGVTIDDITKANPAMQEQGYVLKEGTTICIPVANGAGASGSGAAVQNTPAAAQNTPAVSNTITVGVMLPLHDINGDGRRMVEYYRGMLLALGELKREGYNVEMNAWNVAEDADVSAVLKDSKASKCSVIFGPLYTKQVPEMSRFCQEHDIRMVIPFSISGTDVQTCPAIHQVYQTPDDIDAQAIDNFMTLFKDSHPIFVDCNDATSKKGAFTNALRTRLYNNGVQYSITNSKNTVDLFAKAFVAGKRNVVVLNTGRSPELGQVIQLLDQLTARNPSLQITLFGYNEWFMYAKVYGDKFKKYDAYVPSVYDYNATSPSVQRIEKLYASYFGQPMQQAIPRFALTGYDQLMFFVKGMRQYGVQFHGLPSQKCYTPVQTPYSFQKYPNGGYKNNNFMLIRYK